MSRLRYPSLFVYQLCSLLLLLPLLAATPCALAATLQSPGEQQSGQAGDISELTVQDWQQLDQQLQELLVELRETASPDKAQQSAWQTRQQALHQRLQALEALAASAPDSITARKLETIRALLHNLRLALDLHQRSETAGLVHLRADRSLPVGTVSKAAAANDSCANARPLQLGQVLTGSLSGASTDGESSCGQPGSHDVWFRYTATEEGYVGFDSSGSNFDTVVSVHRGCPGLTSNEISCNDDSFGLQGAAFSSLDVGEEVFIRLAGFDAAATGDYELSAGRSTSIEGHVLSDLDGEPVEASVYVCSLQSGFFLSSTSTDTETGRYSIGSLVSSFRTSQPVYMHTLWAVGHADELYDDIPRLDRGLYRCGTRQVGTELAWTPGNNLTDVDFSLAPGGRLSGQVRYEDGTPASELIRLTAYNASGRIFTEVLTDPEDGTYRIDVLPSGEYFVVARAYAEPLSDGVLYDGQSCSPDCNPLDGTPVSIEVGEETTGIDFILPDGPQIRGRVTDLVGKALAGVEIRAFRADGRADHLRSTLTDANGEYLMRNLPPWGFFLTAEAEGYERQYFDGRGCGSVDDCFRSATVIDLQPTGRHYPSAQADFEMRPLDGTTSTIEGVVTDTQGSPVVGTVRAFDDVNFKYLSASIEPDGSYRLRTTPGETYYVYTSTGGVYEEQVYGGETCPLYYAGESPCDPLRAIPIVAQESAISGIDFQLVPHPLLRGSVTDITGAPLAGVKVNASTDPTYGSLVFGNFDTTDANGDFAIPVTAGTYYLLLESGVNPQLLGAPICEPTSIFGADSCSTEGATAFTVSPAGLDGVDVQARALGSLRGRVTDMQGNRVSSRVGLYRLPDRSNLSVSTDAKGDFAFARIPTGEYRLFVDGNPRWLDEIYQNLPCLPDCPDLEQGTPLIFEGAQEPQTGIDVQLEQLGSLRARIWSTESGRRIYPAGLQLWDASSGERVEVEDALVEGEIELYGILPGAYRLSASAFGHNGQVYGGPQCSGECTQATAGTVITVGLADSLSGFEFHLMPYGGITGRVQGAFTSQGTEASIWIFDAAGERVATTISSDVDGTYTTPPLVEGQYYVGAGDSSFNPLHVPQFYAAIACPDGLEEAPCLGRPANATPVTVRDGELTPDIDFVLTPLKTGVRGTVLGSETYYGPELSSVRIDAWDTRTGAHAGETQTDSRGDYEFELPPGTYFLSSHNTSGYIDEVFKGIACLAGSAWEGRCDPAQGTPVSVGSARWPEVNFQLAKREHRLENEVPAGSGPSSAPAFGKNSASLTGNVANLSGEPLGSIEVLLSRRSGERVASQVTGSDGRYQFSGLEPDIYVLRVRSATAESLYVEQVYDGVDCPAGCPEVFNYEEFGGTPVPVAAEAQITGLDFRLRRGGVLSGNVFTDETLTSSSYPVPSARVHFRNADASVQGIADVEQDGSFRTPPLPQGAYYLTAIDDDFEAQNYDRIPCAIDVTTNPDSLTCDPTRGRAVRAHPGQVTSGIDFLLRPEGTIYGFLFDAVTGEPLPFRKVRLWYQYYPVANLETTSNRAGRFVFDSLPDTTYFLHTEIEDAAGGANYVNALFEGMTCVAPCEPTKGTPLTAPAGVSRRVDFHLQRRPLRLFGTVRNAASSAPLSQVEIQVYDLEGTLVDSTSSQANGTYWFDLPPGQYRVTTSNALGFIDQVYPNQECGSVCDPSTGTSLLLDFETGQRADFDLRSVLDP